MVALIGANGAGKSTTLNTIAGLHPAESGTIRLGGADITNVSAYKIVRKGLVLVPEGRMVVAPLTVEENLELSTFAKRGREGVIERVYSLFPVLADRRGQLAGLLSGGEQQMLAVGRGLMAAPEVLLLDEPSMGLAPAIIDTVFEAIVEIHRSGQSILLVEQNAALALAIADHAYVLHRGELVAHGSPAELEGRPEVEHAYLT